MKKIIINKPIVKYRNGKARLISNVEIEKQITPIWFEVDERYGKYLCDERSDAFVIGLLPFAMKNGYDIFCSQKMSSQLHYQITNLLIPAICINSPNMHPTKIVAGVDNSSIQIAKCVGTSASLGVDSMHVIKNYTNTKYHHLKLTHLCLNNVGAFALKRQYKWMINHASSFCNKYGYELLVTNSNLHKVIKQSHYFTHTYSSIFAIYALQKMWNTYFYGSSGHDLSGFKIQNCDSQDPADYEIFSLDCFSQRNLKIYSEGCVIDRFQKTKELLDFPPAFDYLQVCVGCCGKNCGKCGKCLRTLTTLDALGGLDKFKNSFNIEEYFKNRDENLEWLKRKVLDNPEKSMLQKTYDIFVQNGYEFKNENTSQENVNACV